MQYIVILFIKFYRRSLSPLLPRSCRFYPTCSSYCIMAIEKYGLLRGSLKGILRILRCNPFHPGGYDPIE